MNTEVQEVSRLTIAVAMVRWQITRAWGWLRGLFSLRERFLADVLAALERGEESIVFFWYDDGTGDDSETDGETVPTGLLTDIDNVIRHTLSGVNRFFINVAVYGPRPQDRDSFEVSAVGRRLLRVERLPLIDYRDWRREGQKCLRRCLERNAPSSAAPLIAVQILPLGKVLTAVFRSGRWRPVGFWP